jgi:hypothetical protein
MSVKRVFDEWFNKLTPNEKSEVLGHILNNHCNVACEGFYTGPTGLQTRGVFVAPSGSTSRVCKICGK